jgi:thiamine-phosphate pyrophosphorylase
MKPNPVLSSSIHRIIDANLDRAREGLRVIEEWCRFALNNQGLAAKCKAMRQELAQYHTMEIRRSRDTSNDVGTRLTHPQEENRSNIQHLLLANLARVEEALRVLEEYGKIAYPQMSMACKNMRYQVYTLESNLMGSDRLEKLKQSPLYLVTSPRENIIDIVEKALQGGLTLVQYREKEANDLVRLDCATKLAELCHRYGALFLVNDRVDLALAVNADGVHLGQTDMPISIARQILGHDRIIGRSTTNPTEMAKAIDEGADYIGVGPVYETPTKAGKAAAGLEYVEYAAKNATVPWYAIGGIDNSNIHDVINAGAKQVAVVRAIMGADNPTESTGELLSRIEGFR